MTRLGLIIGLHLLFFGFALIPHSSLFGAAGFLFKLMILRLFESILSFLQFESLFPDVQSIDNERIEKQKGNTSILKNTSGVKRAILMSERATG